MIGYLCVFDLNKIFFERITIGCLIIFKIIVIVGFGRFNKQSMAQVNQNRDFLGVGPFTISFKLS